MKTPLTLGPRVGAARPGRSATTGANELLEALFVFLRVNATHGPTHPQTAVAADVLVGSLAGFTCPTTVSFVNGVAFVDRVLVSSDPAAYRRSATAAAMFAAAGAHEIVFDAAPTSRELLVLAAELVHRNLAEFVSASIRCRPLEHASHAEASESVDRETAAAMQIALGIGDCETALHSGNVWSGTLGALRRIDLAIGHHATAATRALELGGEWDRARRLLSMGRLTLSPSKMLGLAQPTARAATHAAMLVAAFGLRDREGIPLAEAARLAVEATTDTTTPTSSHRLRTLAILWAVAGGRRAVGLAGLLDLTYRLEMRRCPAGVPFDLTLGDLFSEAATGSLGEIEQVWLKLLIQSDGVLPAGARVALADGRVGVVLGPSTRGPWQPEVLVDNRVVTPDSDVRLV